MARAYVALGGNLDDPRAHLTRAFAELSTLPQTCLTVRSALYASAPVGYLNQPDFINAVAELDTTLAPDALLRELLQIEQRHGRYREFPNAPRTLDLDLLLYDDCVLHRHGLTLPHPRMHERAFVLAPLVEIAPLCVIPGRGSAAELLSQLRGQALEKLDAA
ncbi:MAG: 2-amino-4-hydroxy-6-hydroxymethyldihydropteridine diphosphokinase [Pseudomonadota bacterium]